MKYVEKVQANLEFITKTLNELLKGDAEIKIFDVVYRPFDMDVFGGKGYSFTLTIPEKEKAMGFCLTEEEVTLESIEKAVIKIKTRFFYE